MLNIEFKREKEIASFEPQAGKGKSTNKRAQ